jgi:uncharacterized membrane protein YqiK
MIASWVALALFIFGGMIAAVFVCLLAWWWGERRVRRRK